MKRNVFISGAAMLAVVLAVVGVYTSGGVSPQAVLQATQIETATSQAALDQTSNAQEETADQGEVIGDPDATIDYAAIIQEASSEEYRESTEIASETFVVMRTETADSAPVEQETWYQDSFATSSTVVSTTKNVDGTDLVTYRVDTLLEDPWDAVDVVNATGEVEIAEPVYIFHIADGTPSSENSGMSKQWYLDDQDMSSIWSDSTTYGNATGEGSIVAVIDTGVDYTHEDLADNIWINSAEFGGTEGVDDDGNGYVDDIYGINLIDTNATPNDDHGHGTHVAGVIAMEDNDTGGVGIAYKSKIMAIKAGGSDGTLASTDIAKALNYAYRNGADVINMSFGSSAHSAVVERALQDAFSTSVLVAAAGNDAASTLDSGLPGSYNMYPAAYSYVIGVMAYDSTGNLSSFSNWDYKPNYGAEYEVVAPGSNIYSTLPNNRYASWNGTSMATPMVSAVAAVIRSSLPDKSTYSSRYIMGQIASATTQTVTYRDNTYSKLCLADSLTKQPKPNLNIDEVYVFDSVDISSANNGDGIIQPGETVDLAIGVRNQWGAASNAYVIANATSAGGVENPYVEFLNGEKVDGYYQVAIDDIGTFGTQNNGYTVNDSGTVVGVSNPIRVKISENAPNDLNIQFNINVKANNALDAKDTTVYRQMVNGNVSDTAYTVSVVKGTILEGKISSNMTLTADNYYIVKNSVQIPRGVTVTVEPGTQIQFWATDQSNAYADEYMPFILVDGRMELKGTADNPISLFPGKDFESYRVEVAAEGNGVVDMSYVNVTNPYLDITTGDHLNLVQNYDSLSYRYYDSYSSSVCSNVCGSRVVAKTVSNSKFQDVRGQNLWNYANVSGSFDTCLFDSCQISFGGITAVDCTFLDNQGRHEDSSSGTLQYGTSKISNVGNQCRVPSYETASKVYTVNGKKYVLYQFDNFYYDGSWENGVYVSSDYKNYMAIESALQANGGHIAAADFTSEGMQEVLKSMYVDVNGEDLSPWMYIYTGAYYDRVQGKTTTTNGTSYDWNSSDYGCPFMVLTSYHETTYTWDPETETDIETIGPLVNGYTTYSTFSCKGFYYVIAEYSESTDDYTVNNPAFSIGLDLVENTKFTNNAILNRLISKNTSDWMKVSNSYSNDYALMAANNYWGTTDKTLIRKQTIDYDSNIRLGDIVTDPYLSEPAESTYPCVSDIMITDKDGVEVTSVGNGAYTVTVKFNRDMNQAISPMVTYGPDDPYTDYTVTGSWANAREWVGTMTIKTLINQGQQYFRVKDAVAANDSWLTTGTDWARFGFTIGASGAEALTLQAEGVKGAVNLMWTQDEYEMLAGYNVYRSDTGEEGTYAKINTSIIDAKEYSDTTAVSGKKYYYYFTVVDSDMAESRPSNVVICASLDDQAPVISHGVISTITYGLNASVVATITDNVGVNSAYVYYRMQGDTDYKQLAMINTVDNKYSVQIPASALRIGVLEYYIAAADSEQFGYAGSAEEPYSVTVESKVVITLAKADDVQVGTQTSGMVKGLNFTKDVKVRIDGDEVDTTFVSDTEISFTYTPTCMGSKKVELVSGDETLGSYSNAFTVTDDSIKVYFDKATVIKGNTNWVNIPIYTTYSGKLESIEVTYENCNANGYVGDAYISPNYGFTKSSEQYNDGNLQHTAYWKMSSNTSTNAGQIAYMQVHNFTGATMPKLLSVKINGVEIKRVEDIASKVTLIEESAYVAVDEVLVDQTTYTLDVGDSFTPEFSISPSNATMREFVTYNYNSDMLRKNEDGSFTVLRSGGNYLSVTCDGVQSDSIYIYGNTIPLTSITPDKSSYKGTVGSTLTITWDAEPADSEACLTQTNYDPNYVEPITEINNGRTNVYRLKKAGTATIGRGWYNDQTCEIVWGYVQVEIMENTAYAEVDEDIVTLLPNQTKKLTSRVVNVTDDDDSAIAWSSSNSKVVKVASDGTLTSVGKGYAIITAKTANGTKSDSVVVLVGTDSMSYILGDVNMDGSISSVDAMLALKLALADGVVDPIKKIVDTSKDGSLTSGDAMLILKYVTGAISEF